MDPQFITENETLSMPISAKKETAAEIQGKRPVDPRKFELSKDDYEILAHVAFKRRDFPFTLDREGLTVFGQMEKGPTFETFLMYNSSKRHHIFKVTPSAPKYFKFFPSMGFLKRGEDVFYVGKKAFNFTSHSLSIDTIKVNYRDVNILKEFSRREKLIVSKSMGIDYLSWTTDIDAFQLKRCEEIYKRQEVYLQANYDTRLVNAVQERRDVKNSPDLLASFVKKQEQKKKKKEMMTTMKKKKKDRKRKYRLKTVEEWLEKTEKPSNAQKKNKKKKSKQTKKIETEKNNIKEK